MTEFLRKISITDIRNILAVIIVVGSFVLLYLMMIKEIPVPNKDIVLTAVGFIFGSLTTGVAGYYFGASKRASDDKAAGRS